MVGRRLVTLCLVFAILMPALAYNAQPRPVSAAAGYTITDLGTLGGTRSGASAINASGLVVGQSLKATDPNQHAFFWQNGAMNALAELPGSVFSSASGVNAAGDIVGASGGGTNYHATLWRNGVPTDLSTLGGPTSSAMAINNSGQVVGTSDTNGINSPAFIWQNGTMSAITPFVGSSRAYAINDGGVVVGEGTIANPSSPFILETHALIWQNGQLTDLGTMGSDSSAAGINDFGQVVGNLRSATWSVQHATIWNNNQPTDLGTGPLGDGYCSFALGINNKGQVVGWTCKGTHAVLWQNGAATDLNTLLPAGSPWELLSAYGINDIGQVVGTGKINGQEHAYLLTPTTLPDPPCLLSFAGSPGGCARPNSEGRIVILVPGIIAPYFPNSCTGTVCNTYRHVSDSFFPFGSFSSSPLSQRLADLDIREGNIVPFSYGGLDAPTFSLAQNHQEISASALILIQYVLALEENPLVKRVDIISHSLGGVVTATALQSLPAGQHRIRTAITVDSPLKGTEFGTGLLALNYIQTVLGVGASEGVYRDLSPRSTIIRNIQSSMPSDPRFFVANNANDDFIHYDIAFAGSSPILTRSWIAKLGSGSDQSCGLFDSSCWTGHAAVFRSMTGTAAIHQILSSATIPTNTGFDYATAMNTSAIIGTDLSRVVFAMFSPANILITDPSGRRVGYDPVTRAVVNEIPGAIYSGPGTEPQLITIPNPAFAQYHVALTGTGNGQYHLVQEQIFGPSVQESQLVNVIATDEVVKFDTSVAPGTTPTFTPNVTYPLVLAANNGVISRSPNGDNPATGAGTFPYTSGASVTLTPAPDPGMVFTGWTVDGQSRGWAIPLTLTMNSGHTVTATFVPAKTFPDVGADRADYDAIVALATRGNIQGYNAQRYGPDDGVQRAQMAALISRAMSAGPDTAPSTVAPPDCVTAGTWDCEVWDSDFTDQNGLDPRLWRNVGTLRHYKVAAGYAPADCAAKGKAYPCFGPTDPVTYAETITFITRAMEKKGYWTDHGDGMQPYAGVPGVFSREVATFYYYTQAYGGIPAPPGDWSGPATRGWFALALWAALDSYYGH